MSTERDTPKEFTVIADGYGIRPCRGHWHVTSVNDDGSEGEDLWIRDDPLTTRDAAVAAAEALARGEVNQLRSSSSLEGRETQILRGRLEFAATALVAGVTELDGDENGGIAPWFRPAFLLEVSRDIKALLAVLSPTDPPTESDKP